MAAKTTARLPARDRLLASADELFYAHGVNAVGIDRVIEHAGVAKASLYSAFGSKDELIRAYLMGRHAAWAARITEALEARYDTPRERLLGVFDVLGELFAEPSFRGCAFTNASAEAEPGSSVEEVAEEFRGWVHGLFRELADEASATDPEQLARRLVLLYDGASTTAQMDHDPTVAADARAVAEMLVDAAVPAKGRGRRARARSVAPA
ncbi:MAG TPA: TetR/AcrR family transcriptional regulator [Baekduia sp.]|jgi:AcrR family transcriptional regulator|nr:TetR/AcrR family transcriptional regulator [Baekduia sp.]